MLCLFTVAYYSRSPLEQLRGDHKFCEKPKLPDANYGYGPMSFLDTGVHWDLFSFEYVCVCATASYKHSY